MHRNSQQLRAPALRRLGPWSLLVLALVLTGCASSGKYRSAPLAANPVPVLSADYVFAPLRGDVELELADLSRQTTHPARLRRAYIHLQQKHWQDAIDAAAEVIFAADRPSPSEEAYARYLRAEATAGLGRGDRGQADRARARELALDAELIRRLGPVETATRPEPEHLALPALALMPRTAWRPMSPVASRLDPMTRIYRLTVHHSAIYFREDSQAAAANAIRKIQHDHIVGNHWADIGYHFVIDPAGRVWEGRPLRWQGAHSEGANNVGNIGICLLGNFMRKADGQRPTTAQVQSLRLLVAQLGDRYGIGADEVWMHKQFKGTECPGPLLEAVVAQLKRDMKAGHLVDGARPAE